MSKVNKNAPFKEYGNKYCFKLDEDGNIFEYSMIKKSVNEKIF